MSGIVVTNYSGQTVKVVNANDIADYIILEADATKALKTIESGVSCFIYDEDGEQINHLSSALSASVDNYIVYQKPPLTDGAIKLLADADYTDRFYIKGGASYPLLSNSFKLGSYIAFVAGDPLIDPVDPVDSVPEESGYWWILIVVFIIIVIIVVIVIIGYKKYRSAQI